jgi:hypothetical protein
MFWWIIGIIASPFVIYLFARLISLAVVRTQEQAQERAKARNRKDNGDE